MRVTLTQDELFEAISSHLKGKLNLDDSASIEISFTAGRGPKGYTADVEITYPKSELVSKITAGKPSSDDATDGGQGNAAPVPEAVANNGTEAPAATAGAVPTTALFD